MNACPNDDYRILHKTFKSFINDEKIEHFCYGKSFFNRDLIAFHKGEFLGKQFLITGGIHAREFISSFVVMKLLKDYDLPYGCFFIPLLNPDGIELCLGGIETIPFEYKDMILRLNNYSIDFSKWKANGRGVDLNVNFDANWGNGKYNKLLPGPENFIGEEPCSEVENVNLIEFISQYDIMLSLTYHSKGQVIYHGFEGGSKRLRHKTKILAKKFAKNLGYKSIISKNSVGGLSDYLCLKNIPSLTVELGHDNLSHPIGITNLENIYKNQYVSVKNIFNFVRNYD